MTQRRLHKSGVRSPWLPQPLFTAPQNIPLAHDPIVPAPPISAYSGSMRWIGMPRLPEQTRAFAQALIIVGSMVLTPAQVWMPRPLDGNIPTSRPQVEVFVNQQPTPQSNYTLFTRPALEASIQWPQARVVVGQQPVPQSNLLTFTPLRDPDVTRPGQPIIQVNQPPVPGASALLLRVLRDEVVPVFDRLSLTQIVSGQQPIPPAQLTWLVAPKDAPPIQWAVIRSIVGQQPTPQAQALLLRAIRDEVVPAFDRLAFTRILSGWQPVPGATFTLLARPLLEASIQWPRILLSVGQQVYPDASFRLLRALRDLGADHAWPLSLFVGQQPRPVHLVYWLRSGLALPVVPTAFVYGTIRSPGTAGTVLSSDTDGAILGPDTDGTIEG